MQIKQNFKNYEFLMWYLKLMLSKPLYKETDTIYIPYCITITGEEDFEVVIFFTTDKETFSFLNTFAILDAIDKEFQKQPQHFKFSYFEGNLNKSKTTC